MAFIQIIDFETDKLEEGNAIIEEYRAKTAGRRTTQRVILCKDRDRPNHYINIVMFDSYEAAMENSNLPETAEMAEKLNALMSGEPTFYNLDVHTDEDG